MPQVVLHFFSLKMLSKPQQWETARVLLTAITGTVVSLSFCCTRAYLIQLSKCAQQITTILLNCHPKNHRVFRGRADKEKNKNSPFFLLKALPEWWGQSGWVCLRPTKGSILAWWAPDRLLEVGGHLRLVEAVRQVLTPSRRTAESKRPYMIRSSLLWPRHLSAQQPVKQFRPSERPGACRGRWWHVCWAKPELSLAVLGCPTLVNRRRANN